MAATIGLASSPPALAAYVQCVDFARAATGLSLRGDAWQWWDRAYGHYERGGAPAAGAVLVFKRAGKMRYGHVAVVREALSDREVLVDHANWGGSRGRIARAISVIDVSPKNDWTSVRVWYGPTAEHGFPYRTYGFVYPPGRSPRDLVVRGVPPTTQVAEVASELERVFDPAPPARTRPGGRTGRGG